MKDIDLRKQKEKDKPIWRKMISKNKSIIWTDENQTLLYQKKTKKDKGKFIPSSYDELYREY